MMSAEEYLAEWYIKTFPIDILVEFKKHTDICPPDLLNTTAFGGINYKESAGYSGMPHIFYGYNRSLPFKPDNTTYRQVMEIVFSGSKTKRLLKHIRNL